MAANSFTLVKDADGNEVYRKIKPKVPPLRKTLTVLLASLQGSEVVIELKNDGEIRGVIEEVDAKMKIVLRTGLDASNFEYVEGRAIRYVHIPPAINAAAHLESYVRRLDRINAGNRPSVIKDKKKRLASSSMEEIMEPPSKR